MAVSLISYPGTPIHDLIVEASYRTFCLNFPVVEDVTLLGDRLGEVPREKWASARV